MITLLIIIAAIFLVGFIFFSIYNGFIFLKNNIDKAWSNIDVLLKQRNDEVPNLVNIVKGYAKHEKTLFENIAKDRAAVMQASTPNNMARAHNDLSQSLKTLFAVAENYPKLQASENFLKLQQRMTELENQIADRREFYNDSVNLYNIKIESFPDLLMARMMKLVRRQMFQVQENEKEPVKFI